MEEEGNPNFHHQSVDAAWKCMEFVEKRIEWFARQVAGSGSMITRPDPYCI